MFVFNVNQFCLRRNVESRQHTFHFFSHQVADLLIYVYLHMSPNIYVDHVDIYIYIFFYIDAYHTIIRHARTSDN